MRRIPMRGAAALAAMIAIMSCAEHGPTEVIGPVRVASVDVALARTALVAGDSTIASATAHDATGNVMRGLPVVWSSDNPLVATVSADGLVHTMSAGNARIIALIDLVGSYGAISVSPAPVATVKVTLAATALTPGQSTQATAVTADASGAALTGRIITWSSDAPNVATVSSTGLVSALAPGSATIIATSEGRSGSVSLSVTPPPPAPVASITIALAASSLTIGQSAQATAVPRDSTAAPLTGRAVTWTSSDPTVATVSGSGLVTAVAPGVAVITATCEGRSAFALATVAAPPAPVASVAVSINTNALTMGQSTQATAIPRDATGQPLSGRGISWSSTNAAVVTVSSSGVVTAVAAGSADIVATSEGKTGSTTVSVALPPPSAVATVTVLPTSISLTVGKTTPITATVRDSTGAVMTTRVVTWSSSDPAIATVSGAGLVTAVAGGAAIVTATCEGRSASVLVTVPTPPAPVASVVVTLNTSALTVGQSTQATATPRDSIGQPLVGRAISWSSSNSAIATVTPAGVVTAVGAGSADIVATSEAKAGSATLSVAPIPPTPVASVAVTLASASLSVGESTQATATTYDATGGVLTGRAVVWSSDNPAVATVSATGLVSAVGPGATDVVAMSEGMRGSSAIQVRSLPTQLGFAVPPAGAVSGLALTTQPVVLVRDAAGNLVNTSTANVTAAITAGAGTLVGTTTVAPVNGIAVFTDLRIDGAGAHTLTFTATGLASASASLTVTQTPATLVVLTQPAGATTGSSLATQPVVQVLDNAGRPILGSSLAVAATIASGTGTLTGSPATAVDGVATFSGLRVDGSGAVTLAFSTASPALRVVSATFPVAVGPAAKLTMAVQPSPSVTSAVPFPTQPVVQLRDVADNAVAQSGVAVTASIASGGGTLAGGTTVTTDASGLATFSDLSITGFDGPRTLAFHAPAMTDAISATVTLTPPADVAAACPNQPPGYVTVQDQPWDVTPALNVRTSLGWIDDDGSAATRLSVMSDPTSRFPSANHNVAAGLFKQGDPGGDAPFRVYRIFDAAEEHRSLYLCVYAKHSADFDNTNGNTGTKFLFPAGDQYLGTQTYAGHDGSNMDFQFFQQGAVDRRLAANLDPAAARLLMKRGEWVRYEILLKASSDNSVADGELHVWIDGVKTHQYTDVQWQMGSARTWLSLMWNPTYGGGTNPVPLDQYQYIDHIHVAGGP